MVMYAYIFYHLNNMYAIKSAVKHLNIQGVYYHENGILGLKNSPNMQNIYFSLDFGVIYDL